MKVGVNVDEYMRKKLEKIDMISEAIIRIETKMEILETYDKKIEKNSRDIDNVGKKTRDNEENIQKNTDKIEAIEKKMSSQNGVFTKITCGIITAMGGAIVYLAKKLGIF